MPINDESSPKSAPKRAVAERSWYGRLWYHFSRLLIWTFLIVRYRIEYEGRENIPSEGAFLMVSNHQSHFDPPVVGTGVPRQMSFLARKTLFRSAPFRWLIRSYDAIPLNQEGLGVDGIKQTLRRLKEGKGILIFPEGSRTFDGTIQPFKPGFLTLAYRGKAAIVPTAVSGAFQAWPRTRKYPFLFRPVKIRVKYGPPITPEEVKQHGQKELQDLVEHRVRKLFEEIDGRR
jgi:1-acyl-sn-glycerol-3-phosphate acyltransferase